VLQALRAGGEDGGVGVTVNCDGGRWFVECTRCTIVGRLVRVQKLSSGER